MLSAISLLLVIVIALAWLRYGFWNGFLHMACVFVAGALAFAFWEPLAMYLLGTGQQWLMDGAWGLALGVPFAVILLAIRLACDKIIPSNLNFDSIGNIIGGGVCGFISGTISVGILVISVGNLRLDSGFMGYQPVEYQSGSLVKKDSLLFPVDKITASVYSALSHGSFMPSGSSDSLVRWYPDIAMHGPLLRTNYDNGASRNTMPPDAAEFLGMYVYTSDKEPKALLSDGVDLHQDRAAAKNDYQNVMYLDGTAGEPAKSRVEGYVVRFKAGAKEQSGRVVVGPGQVQLVVQADLADASTSRGIQPFAVISQATGDKSNLGRWRFNQKDVFIASMSGRDDAPMAFEFLVPKDTTPIALYVKGVRYDLGESKPFATYTNQADRDAAVRSGAITPTQKTGALKRTANTSQYKKPAVGEGFLRISGSLPRITLQKDNLKGLEINDAREIVGGTVAKFSRDDLKNFVGEAALQVRKFQTDDSSVIVQVQVDNQNTVFGLISNAATGADPTKPPLLIDQNGVGYSAIGYLYKFKGETWIYYNPQMPIQAMEGPGAREMPGMTISKPDQELILFFRVPRNVKITNFAIGDQVITDFVPPEQMPPPK